jgi:tRNA (mo5U34)-methyltransferase
MILQAFEGKESILVHPNLSKESIAAHVSAFPFWYHRIQLPHDIVTPGWAPLHIPSYRIPERLDGKRVLDVGAWDGFWSFEALRRGAAEVVAIDDFSDFLGLLGNDQRKAWETFDLCRSLLGYDEARCRRTEMTVYDVSEELLGRFDVVFFFGTLYHLRHPLLALDRLSAVCDGEIFVESAILDDFSPYRGGLGHGYSGGQLVTEFYPGNQYANNQSNWWVPSIACLLGMIEAAGFSRCLAWKLTEQPTELRQCRGFAHGKKP